MLHTTTTPVPTIPTLNKATNTPTLFYHKFSMVEFSTPPLSLSSTFIKNNSCHGQQQHPRKRGRPKKMTDPTTPHMIITKTEELTSQTYHSSTEFNLIGNGHGTNSAGGRLLPYEQYFVNNEHSSLNNLKRGRNQSPPSSSCMSQHTISTQSERNLHDQIESKRIKKNPEKPIHLPPKDLQDPIRGNSPLSVVIVNDSSSIGIVPDQKGRIIRTCISIKELLN